MNRKALLRAVEVLAQATYPTSPKRVIRLLRNFAEELPDKPQYTPAFVLDEVGYEIVKAEPLVVTSRDGAYSMNLRLSLVIDTFSDSAFSLSGLQKLLGRQVPTRFELRPYLINPGTRAGKVLRGWCLVAGLQASMIIGSLQTVDIDIVVSGPMREEHELA